MPWRTSRPNLITLAGIRFPFGCSHFILQLGGVYLAAGAAALVIWLATGNDRWVIDFFRYPAAVLSTGFALIQMWFSQMAAREFHPEQPMGKAWKLIAHSAACDVISTVCVQILGAKSALNPLSQSNWWADVGWAWIRDFGLAVGGPMRYGLLAAGLAYALRAYKRSGLQARWKLFDWIVLAAMGLYIALEIGEVVTSLRHGLVPPPAMVLGWPTDPLLWLLLGQALLLYRSAQHMRGGWIARCWYAFSIGVFLAAAGDIAMWATNMGYLSWPWSALEWYIGLPAAGVFALGPAYQLEAIAHARMPGAFPEQASLPSVSG